MMAEQPNQKKETVHQTRLHALDNLRALLALLGIPFHAALLLFLMGSNASPTATFDLYALTHHAPVTHTLLFLSTFFFHVFRMPAFFLLAGFFAHFIYQRSGIKKFLVNRFIRIGLPFLCIMSWLFPTYLNAALLTAAHINLVNHQDFLLALLTTVQNDWHTGKIWLIVNNTRDSWFLYDLLWFYGASLLLLSINHLTPLPRIRYIIDYSLEKCLFSIWGYIILPISISLLLMTAPFPTWFVYFSVHLTPDFTLLVLYGLWYFFGWWLWQHHQRFSYFMKCPGTQFIGALLCYIFYLALYLHFTSSAGLWIHWLCLLLYSFSMVLGVFGLIGLAWRYLNRAQSWLGYISQSAYWVYLTQLPILLFIVPLIALTQFPFYAQFLIDVLLCGVLCLLSYHVLVRPTWLRHIIGARK